MWGKVVFVIMIGVRCFIFCFQHGHYLEVLRFLLESLIIGLSVMGGYETVVRLSADWVIAGAEAASVERLAGEVVSG